MHINGAFQINLPLLIQLCYVIIYVKVLIKHFIIQLMLDV